MARSGALLTEAQWQKIAPLLPDRLLQRRATALVFSVVSKGAIFCHCASVSNAPDRAIGPPRALLILLISHLRKFNYLLFKTLY